MHFAVNNGTTATTPFYIGMGNKPNRLSEDGGRNQNWYESAKDGWTFIKVAENLTQEEALKHEADLIEEFDNKCDTLTNWHIGDNLRGSFKGLTKLGKKMKSQVMSGDKHYFYGKKREDHTKWAIENDHGLNFGKGRRPVIVDGIDYRSVNAAAREYGIHTKEVGLRCKSEKPEYTNWEYND